MLAPTKGTRFCRDFSQSQKSQCLVWGCKMSSMTTKLAFTRSLCAKAAWTQVTSHNMLQQKPEDRTEQDIFFSFFPMRSEGFLLNSGGLEVGVVFAQRCASDRSMFATAMGSLSLTIGRRLQNVIRMRCSRSISLQIA